MRLGVKDHKVIRAFVEHRAAEGHKLSTDGKRLDGHWLGGSRIADWSPHGIVFHDLGSRAAEAVQRQIRYHAAPNQLAEFRKKFAETRRAKRDPKRLARAPSETVGHVVIKSEKGENGRPLYRLYSKSGRWLGMGYRTKATARRTARNWSKVGLGRDRTLQGRRP